MKKIFLIIWADPKFYQTLIFLSQKFANKKFEVFILCRNLGNFRDVVKKVNFGKNVKLIESPNFLNFRFNLLDYLIFNIFILFHIIVKNPKNVIYFNKKALFNILITKIFTKKTNFIYHNFDFDLTNSTKSLIEKIMIKLEFYSSKFCNYLIFPSKERLKMFKKFSMNNLSKYYYFMNCFPKKFKTNNSLEFKKFLINNNLQSKNIICHLGSIGPKHFLEEIVDSFKYVNNKLILVIAGSPINSFAEKLKRRVNVNNLRKKIYIFENINNDYWFEILKRSDLGLCFYKQTTLSHRYMAGTSQKFNNYLFFNLPMIVNDNKDFQKFKKNHDIFEMVNPKNSKMIAQKITKLISKKNRYKKIKQNMNISFNKSLNFEAQFNKSYNCII